MTKSEFLTTLDRCLLGLSYEEKKDIIYDYEEHFRNGIEEGKTEEEICTELGDPKNIAKIYSANLTLKKAKANPSSKNLAKAVIAGVSLGFFNLIIGLPVFFTIFGIIASLFGIFLFFTLGGIVLTFSSFINNIDFVNIPFDISVNPMITVLFGIGLTALGILIGIAGFYIVKSFFKWTIKYLNWNLNIIKNN